MGAQYENGQQDPRDNRVRPYEYPALEPEVGYWAERWAEFTRLMSVGWNDGYTKSVVIGSTTVVVVTMVGSWLFGWR
ncbi:hypothetical protein R3P82_08840 [Dietzia maris]|uniref:Uncharacterized protein n=1 Tax=Dietzia maris TaxID=37915 RepID=A0AAE4TZG1_9ACTN|nr:hypothetical protein [Dietzia maris]MDV6299220.1 hypothetical protein [Dietzia maris]